MSPKRWYEKGLRFQCTQCGNCCRNHGDYDHVYLAEADVSAIAGYLDLPRDVFLRDFCVQEDGWVSLRMDEPVCPFLEALPSAPGTAGPPEGSPARMGCRIYPVRPKQCATGPSGTTTSTAPPGRDLSGTAARASARAS